MYDEHALVRRFQAGDETAFDAIYLSYRDRLLSASRAAGADAEDVVQEAFVRLWQVLHRLPEDVRLYAYAYVVARRLARVSARARANVEPVPDLDLDVLPEEPDLLGDDLRGVLDDLPPEQRAALSYRVLDSLPRGVVARLLDIPPREVDVLVARALLALRRRLT